MVDYCEDECCLRPSTALLFDVKTIRIERLKQHGGSVASI